MQRKIYTGTVLNIDAATARVRVDNAQHCSCCAIAGACHGAAVAETISARIPKGMSLGAGDAVKLRCPSASQHASLTFYVAIPCAILIVASLLASMLPIGANAAAIAPLVLVGAYYLITLLLRRKSDDWKIDAKA